MRFVDVKLRCSYNVIDGCTETGAEGDDNVTTVTLQLNGTKPREIDLCKGHREALVDDLLMKLMQEDGRTVEGAAPRRKSTKTSTGSASSAGAGGAGGAEGTEVDLVCRVPDCSRNGRPLKNNTGLAQHVIKAHGYADLASYRTDIMNGTE